MKNKRWVPRHGEVVAIKNGFMGEKTYRKVISIGRGKDNEMALLSDGKACVLYAMRPLTKRERGGK